MTKPELLQAITNDPTLAQLQSWTLKYLRQNLPADPAHSWDHFVRVACLAAKIADGQVPFRHLVAAAFFHDIVTVAKNSPDRVRASQLSADLALQTLPQFGFSADDARHIADAVRTHSYSRGEAPTSFLGQVLQDADRLEALGAIGLYRVIATGVQMGSEFFDVNDPWATNRALDDKKFSIDHFFTKLLKLPTTMQTTAGKEEAAVRAQVLIDFLGNLGEELGEPLTVDRFQRLLTTSP